MTLPLEALASAHSRGAKSPHLATVEAWTRALLAAIPEGETRTTRDLIARLGIPDTDQTLKKRLTQSLWVLRKAGMVEDCYSYCPKRRWMGNPLILWNKPQHEDIF